MEFLMVPFLISPHTDTWVPKLGVATPRGVAWHQNLRFEMQPMIIIMLTVERFKRDSSLISVFHIAVDKIAKHSGV